MHISTRKLWRHTPDFFTSNALDFDYDPDARDPVEFLAFLNALWGSDRQSIETVQEWAGYLLTPDTRQQKILMIVGPKRSGKGTIARVLTSLLGISKEGMRRDKGEWAKARKNWKEVTENVQTLARGLKSAPRGPFSGIKD